MKTATPVTRPTQPLGAPAVTPPPGGPATMGRRTG